MFLAILCLPLSAFFFGPTMAKPYPLSLDSLKYHGTHQHPPSPLQPPGPTPQKIAQGGTDLNMNGTLLA